MTKREQMGHEIVNFEGRFKNGKLQVYKLPSGDGGGAYEIAGINERYHPQEALKLKNMIDAGENEKAKDECADYIVHYTDEVLNFFPDHSYAEANPHIEFLLRDSAFNRGPRGAGTILQLAIGAQPVDGMVGPKTREVFKKALDESPSLVATGITQARETYERNSYAWKKGKRDESSKFWAGLSNRWAKAQSVAEKLV